MSALPNFNEGPLSMSKLREDARRQLVDALDSRRGKKILVLDPKVSGTLGLLAEVSMLKEHGVEQLIHLGTEPLGEVDVKSVLYLVKSRVENAQLIAQQIKAHNRSGYAGQVEFSVFFIPRRTIVCEKIFQEEGVYGDIVIGEYPLDIVPIDNDVLSFELDTAYRELAVDDDRSSLYYIACGIMRMQEMFGTIRYIRGKGTAANAVKDMLIRMRREVGNLGSTLGAIDTLILLDREVDMITPMCTQLTYEGLIDEVLRIKNGVVSLDQEGTKQRIALNSADKVYRELRDIAFGAVGGRLGEKAKNIQTDYKESKAQERSISELKQFASQLKALPNITRHIGLAEHINKQISTLALKDRVAIEQQLLDGHGVDSACEAIEDLMMRENDLMGVLRLLVLVSLINGGVPKKYFDSLRREILHTFGHEHILTLNNLQAAGLLKKQETTKGHFAAIKKSLNLLVDDIDDKDPRDIAYTYSGYAPLSVRLVDEALRPGGWASKDDILEKLPGLHFEVAQLLGQGGQAADMTASATGGEERSRKVVLVVFIGGVTFAEISALRFLSRQREVNIEFVIATTKLVNGSTLLDSLVDEPVKKAMERTKLEV